MTFSIEVKNKLKTARRDIHVRLKRWEEILGEERVGYPENEEAERIMVGLPLGVGEGEDEYWEIDVDDPQADLGPCKITLPSNVPFTFIPAGAGSLAVTPLKSGGNVTSLGIPSGLPAWRLAIKPPEAPEILSYTGDEEKVNVEVAEDDPGGEG